MYNENEVWFITFLNSNYDGKNIDKSIDLFIALINISIIDDAFIFYMRFLLFINTKKRYNLFIYNLLIINY